MAKKHKLTKKGLVAKGSYREECCVCGDVLVQPWPRDSSPHLITRQQLETCCPGDVIVEDWVYHTCETGCVEIFKTNPLPYIG